MFQRASATSLSPRTKTPPKTQPAKKANPTQSLAKLLQTDQEQTSNTTTQRHTSQADHPRQIPQVSYAGQTGHAHWSDRSSLGSSGWTTPAGPLPQIQTSISRSTDLCKTLGIVGTPHGECFAPYVPKRWACKLWEGEESLHLLCCTQ
jgi:hypothetical protein